MHDIDKSKFNLINNDLNNYKDDSFSGKPVGFFLDGIRRFRKNKISVVAFFIISILVLMTIIGPFMRNHTLHEDEPRHAAKFVNLPPRIRGLEHLGIFNGTRILNGRVQSQIDSWPEGVFIRIIDSEVIQGVTLYRVEVDYYLYTDFRLSQQVQNFSLSQLQTALQRNALLEIVSVDLTTGVYRVRVNMFRYALGMDAHETYFWFGTGQLGGDLFTDIWVGARLSITLAVVIMLINLSIGVAIGSVIGYYGGTVDIIFERIIDILNGIPFMVILTLSLLIWGQSIGVIILAFVATGWIGAYGQSRIQAYRYKAREFVLSARTYGASDFRIIFKHILPNAAGTLITIFALAIPAFIMTEATFSFLGILQIPGVTGVGQLLASGQSVMQHFPHLILFPAIFIGLLMLAFNLFSNGLRDALNPSLRGVEE